MTRSSTDRLRLRAIAASVRVGFGAMICVPLASGATQDPAVTSPVHADHWRGTATRGGTTWEFALDVGADSVSIAVPSLWVPRTEIEREPSQDGAVAFEFPWRLGQLSFRSGSESVAEGRLVPDEGDAGPVRLERAPAVRLLATDLVVTRDSEQIAATATTVHGAQGRRPAVVILHGGGDSCRADSPPYRFWGESLAERGLVAVTYDKRGNGGSTGDWRAVGFEERADDVLALVDWLRAQPNVDPARVGLLAVSQGCWVASIAAARDPAIAFVVQISGPAVTPLDADTHALAVSLRKAGLTPAEIDEGLALWRLECDAVCHPTDAERWAAYERANADARERPWYAKARYGLTRPDDPFARWYHRVADRDPARVLPSVKAPMLWLYGDHDTQSDVGRNVEILERLRLASHADFTIARFPRADHGVMAPVDETGRALGPTAAAAGFFERIDEWLAQHRVADRP